MSPVQRHRATFLPLGGIIVLLCLGHCLVLLVFSKSAWGLDPSKYVTQYAHTAWKIRDGFFRSVPTMIAQTNDGWLWIGTRSGLLRFDGVRFESWKPDNGEQLPSLEIYSLLVSRDESLWIGTSAGLSRWKDKKLSNFPGIRDGVGFILEDEKGDIWFTRLHSSEKSGPLCEVLGQQVRCYGLADGVPSLNAALSLAEDAQHNFWVGGDTGVFRWRTGSSTSYVLRGLKTNVDQDGVRGLAATNDGSLWVGIAKAGGDLGLRQLVRGQWKSFVTPELDGRTLAVTALLLDHDNALWVGTHDNGIYRIHRGSVSHFDVRDGLSSDLILSFHEDREGNLWVATSEGLDRFSDTPVVRFSRREGLTGREIDSVLASRDGSIWIGEAGSLDNLRNGIVSSIRAGKGLPGEQVTSLLEDSAGRLWVGVDNGLWILQKGSFERQLKRRDGSSIGLVLGITEERDGSVWVEAVGPPRRLIHIKDLVVREEYPEPQVPGALRVAADPTGGIWLGLSNGDLAQFRNGQLSSYKFDHADPARVFQLLVNVDGSVLAATSYGLIGWRKGELLKLTVQNGLPCDAVYAMTPDNQGNLWLFTECGLAEVESTELLRWLKTPRIMVSIRVLDELDGVRTGRAPFVAAAKTPDGRLWFVNLALLEMIDPARIATNTLPPPVHIEELAADGTKYPTTGDVRLAALTRNIQIDYTALSLVIPQRVRFRYRLEGKDKGWQETGTRRQAFYNDLGPGNYRFHVVACNNDGIWNDAGATLEFSVAPSWYQTRWFLLVSAGMVVFVVWMLYTLRVRRLAEAIGARFDERLAERTRVARELHDTLLQTVQGGKLVADHALKKPDDHVRMVRAVEQLSIWLSEAAEQVRAAVKSLRVSTTEKNDLADAFRRAIEECRNQSPMEGSLSVEGAAKEMHPVVQDEVYRIGYEAIRNACTHSRGTQLEVSLTYARDFTARVKDNGVGIDAAIAEKGKVGHFGLQGMRERADRIGAKFTLTSSDNSGTEIAVVIPGRVIFRKAATHQAEQ